MEYPAWQKVIREAQGEAEKKQRESNERIAAERLANRVQNGQNLVHVLSFFGIQGELDVDVVTVDNYRFRLHEIGRRNESSYYYYKHPETGKETIGFNLLVSRILPEYEPDGFEWPGTTSWLDVGRRLITEEEKQSWLVGLATSIDEIDRVYNDLYPKYLAYKTQEAEPRADSPVVKKLTIEEQIHALIQRIVEKELDRRNEDYY